MKDLTEANKFELDFYIFSQFKIIVSNNSLTSKEHRLLLMKNYFWDLPVTCLLFLLVFNVCRFRCSVNVRECSSYWLSLRNGWYGFGEEAPRQQTRTRTSLRASPIRQTLIYISAVAPQPPGSRITLNNAYLFALLVRGRVKYTRPFVSY